MAYGQNAPSCDPLRTGSVPCEGGGKHVPVTTTYIRLARGVMSTIQFLTRFGSPEPGLDI